MSLVSLSAVSSIHRTGKSMMIARIVSRTISIPELSLRSRRTGGAAVSPTMPSSAIPAGWMCVAIVLPLLQLVEVTQIELRGDRDDDHHQDPVRRGAAGVKAEERDLVDVVRERLRGAARTAAREDVDEVEEPEGLDRPEHHRDQQQRRDQR